MENVGEVRVSDGEGDRRVGSRVTIVFRETLLLTLKGQ